MSFVRSRLARRAACALLCAAASPFAYARDGAAQAVPPAVSSANSPTEAPVDPERLARGRRHFERGLTFLQSSDYNSALAEFRLSYELTHRPSVLFNLGVTYRALHQYPQAERALEQYLREATDVSPERREQVARVLTEVRENVGYVTVAGVPDGAELRVDGERVGVSPLAAPLVVATGRHVIEVVAAEHHNASEWVLVAGGERLEVRVSLRRIEATPAAPAAPARGVLLLRNVPRGATVEVDGVAVSADEPLERDAGVHAVRIRAGGFAAYEGFVELAPRARRSVTARRASTRGVTPLAFALTGVAALGFGATAAVFGVRTMSTRAEFLSIELEGTGDLSGPQEQRAVALAREGNRARDVTNAMLVCAGLSAAATVVLATQTRFSTRASAIEVAALPFTGGALVHASVRF